MRITISVLLFFIIAGCSNNVEMPQASTPIPLGAIPTVNPNNAELAEAQKNYNSYCAHCHGYGGEGQREDTAERTRSLGYHVVPPHDASGHTWRHPDQILFEAIKYGIDNPTTLFPMSPFGDPILSDDEIFNVIEYMKRWWTDDQRAWQNQVTEQFAEDNPRWTPDERAQEQE